jgi:hypothetical protein
VTGRGWGAAAGLALLTTVSAAVHPLLLIVVPLALLLLSAPPPRPALIAIVIALAGVLLIGGAGGTLWYAERGWSLMAAGWFVVVVALWPGASFTHRALLAVGGTAASALVLLAVRATVWAELDWAVAERLRESSGRLAALGTGGAGPAALRVPDMSALLYRWSELNAWLFPALLALSTVGGFGLAWWAYRRIGFREPAPLGRLREFRFRAELAWVVVAGAALVVLARGEWWWPGLGVPADAAVRTGANLLVFMGALYVLRGVAVLVTMAAGWGTLSLILAAVMVVVLYPLVLATALLVGLTDTWVDLRGRWQAVRGARE